MQRKMTVEQMNNKVLVKLYVPEISQSYDLFIPVNEVIWKICSAIARRGIKARPFMDIVFKKADDEWVKKWANQIFNAIIQDLNGYFNK